MNYHTSSSLVEGAAPAHLATDDEAFGYKRHVRARALALGLIVRRAQHTRALVLFERYPPQRRLGVFQSWAAVEQAVAAYGAAFRAHLAAE